MISFNAIGGALAGLLQHGGWVAGVQLTLSVLGLAAVFWKLWQFNRLRVGRHTDLRAALAAADRSDFDRAKAALEDSRSHLAAPLRVAVAAPDRAGVRGRTEAELGANLAKLESGFRLFDTIAQIAPLLGLFGTVLGMIAAFQAMQAAGSSTDPADLAGGIGVALLTTAIGLAISIPASAFLSWMEARVSRERTIADRLLNAITAQTPLVAAAPNLTERLRDVA